MILAPAVPKCLQSTGAAQRWKKQAWWRKKNPGHSRRSRAKTRENAKYRKKGVK